jgi:thiol:disulfide interchange protein DsbD
VVVRAQPLARPEGRARTGRAAGRGGTGPDLGRRPAADGRAQTDGEDALTFSTERLQQLRTDKRVVFVNITADWCVTCKANERGVFSTTAFRNALAAHHAYMVGDWTDVDPRISAFLAEHKAVGVPLYVVYGPDAPAVLPTVLTGAMVAEALDKAGR